MNGDPARSDLPRRFVRFVRSKQLVRSGDHVLVAVSGGIDSMVLLHLFSASASHLGITIGAAHFDHAMRAASAADAEWLAGVCAAWKIPLTAERSARALYGENAARDARYAFLTNAASRTNASRIATAHHADDQIETVLFRLMRGTGLRGLSGIPVRRGAIIRPLLRFRKSELEMYAAEQGIRFREDETNATDAYARNRIRRAVIPSMQTVVPAAPEGVLAIARHAARAERGWAELLKDVRRHVVITRGVDFIELARGILLEYDPEIRARLVRAELRALGVVPDRRATASLMRFLQKSASGRAALLIGDLRCERAYDVLRIRRASAPVHDEIVTIESCDEGSAVARLAGREWTVNWTTSRGTTEPSARLDCASLAFPLHVRSWRPGDRMRFSYGTKKLKKVFGEARVPAHERAALPVLVDANGRVYWVTGVARSVDAPPQSDNQVLTVTIEHAEIG
jgi:tRNA(Ile)-lysidine synthase